MRQRNQYRPTFQDEVLNDERIDLIHKKYEGGLTQAETERLAALEEIVSAYLAKVAPLPRVPEIEED